MEERRGEDPFHSWTAGEAMNHSVSDPVSERFSGAGAVSSPSRV